MRGLFLAEGVHGLDPLELGRVEGGSIGPVVFRLLDADGRLTGSLAASSMRMEASYAARSVTLVLTEGYESRGGERYPFSNGERRIPLVHIDPSDWIEMMPELFPSEDVIAIVDDGEWEVQRLRIALDDVLQDNAGNGWYELRHLAGVVDDELRGVHLVERDRDGRVLRDLVADAMRLELGELGVVLVLRDGVTIQGERTLAFLDGVMRLVLPRASHARWRRAELPGIPTEAPAAGSPPAQASTSAPTSAQLVPLGEGRD